jgi:riboflavin biosynthesis pyrimidine reductase
VILDRVHPGPVERIDVAGEGARDAMRGWYAVPDVDWLRCNLIASVDGSAAGADGTSETLSNPADRAILGAIRSLADVVLVGAETIRAEGYLLPRRSRLAVLTRSGDLTGARVGPVDGPERGTAAGAPRPELVVLGPASAEARARATAPDADIVFHATPGAGAASPTDVVAILRGAGMRSIVCEGGPSLVAQLLDAGLVDELCLSTSPQLAGTGLPVLGAPPPRRLALGHLLVDDAGGVYARWRVEG